MNRVAMWMLAAVLVGFIGGCEGGNEGTPTGASSNPLESSKTHDLSVNGNKMTDIPAIDDDILVNVVENGNPTYAAVADVVTVVWNGPNSGWYPRGGKRADFNASSISITVPTHEKGGQICYITKDKRVLWMNTDYVTVHGEMTVDTDKGLVSY